MRKWIWIVVLTLGSSTAACGAVRASQSNENGGENGNDDASVNDVAAAIDPSDASATPSATSSPAHGHGCAMQFSGTYNAGTKTGSAFAMMEDNEVYLECAFEDGDKWNTVGLGIGNSLAPGTVTADLVIVDQSCAGGCALEVDGPCTVNVETLDPLEKSGFRATFSCASSGEQPDSVAIEGSFDLAPPSRLPLPSTSEFDAGPPSCTLDVSGAYDAHVEGEGNNYECYGDSFGTSFATNPSIGFGGLQVQGESWCDDCIADYETDAGCTEDVILDEGVGGRFVATFACTSLRALDGSEVSVAGKIDGQHVPPPD